MYCNIGNDRQQEVLDSFKRRFEELSNVDNVVQEVTLILMEKPSELIEGLHERGEMLYFIYKIAKNQAQSETSPFYTTYKKFNSKSVNIDETKI